MEYAKDKVWEESYSVLKHQIYVFGKQLHRIQRLIGKVDVIITDGPLLNSLIYGKNEVEEFHALVRAVSNKFDSWNFFLERNKNFNPAGRLQTEEEAMLLDGAIYNMLVSERMEYAPLPAVPATAKFIADEIIKQL